MGYRVIGDGECGRGVISEFIKGNKIAKGLSSEPQFPEKSRRPQQLGCGTAGSKGILKASFYDLCLYKEHLTNDIPHPGHHF